MLSDHVDSLIEEGYLLAAVPICREFDFVVGLAERHQLNLRRQVQNFGLIGLEPHLLLARAVIVGPKVRVVRPFTYREHVPRAVVSAACNLHLVDTFSVLRQNPSLFSCSIISSPQVEVVLVTVSTD